jgi:hypothetical protein
MFSKKKKKKNQPYKNTSVSRIKWKKQCWLFVLWVVIFFLRFLWSLIINIILLLSLEKHLFIYLFGCLFIYFCCGGDQIQSFMHGRQVHLATPSVWKWLSTAVEVSSISAVGFLLQPALPSRAHQPPAQLLKPSDPWHLSPTVFSCHLA